VSAIPHDEHWFISVADTGIGVPQAERESLFERFYRASNARTARIPGSGLGLSVARAIAQLHGGEISISGGEQGGTVVLVSLPMGFARGAARTDNNNSMEHDQAPDGTAAPAGTGSPSTDA